MSSVVSPPSPRDGIGAVPHAGPWPPLRQRLSVGALTSLVIGSMIGSGVFSLPQNMAAGAGAGAILIGWGITALGMLSLAMMFLQLARAEPDVVGGVYGYARAGFGDFIGFQSAWGYWLSALIGNAGYLIVIVAAVSNLLPAAGLGAGNTGAGVAVASVLLWAYHALALRGVRTAAAVNMLVTLSKLVPLLMFVGLVAVAFQAPTFSLSMWGDAKLGPVFDQVRSTMLVTVWAFIGIEGASVFSARAREARDVGRATMLGFGATLVLYMAITLLSLGVVPQAELAQMANPSMAGVLQKVVGPWGAVLVNLGLLVSVGGAMLAWTLLAAEVPYSAAKEQVFPAGVARENLRQAPAAALWWSNGIVQAVLLLSLLAGNAYLVLIKLATSTILLPYLLCALFALRRGAASRGLALTGALATVYSAWLVYAAGPVYLLLTALVYVPGLAVHALARRRRGLPVYAGGDEQVAAVLLLAAAFVTLWLIAGGTLDLQKI
ncbi:basic amino acid/polyamine antiporter [Rhizobacter sp. OV335]|uniref:basic amino acid/polyamine antiporter n=1 Tax=Rhizobacter sp. OV335 TaxID=1500264 RepID=UPI00090EBD9F|nr:basic amino acid/polyamine antiporter [Rhizobacter sp. OV335]SHN37981.1 arginine:ornithine antiporter / lysine permease [Rhizobacter sp. OV335]